MIGGGNNLLFDDSGYRGLIIRNRLEGIALDEGRMSVLSGTGLPCVLRDALAASLCGLEYPGRHPRHGGGRRLWERWGVRLEYRRGPRDGRCPSAGRPAGDAFQGGTGVRLQGFGLQEDRGIVLSATLLCSPGDSRESEAKIRDILEKRRTKHPPLGTACAGSYFKNSCSATGARIAAGQLLQQAGARGLAVGDAAVYENHCNFIINRGNARSSDVLALAEELKDKVYKAFGVRLEEEVIYLRADASML